MDVRSSIKALVKIGLRHPNLKAQQGVEKTAYTTGKKSPIPIK
jgi:hypothetical protein